MKAKDTVVLYVLILLAVCAVTLPQAVALRRFTMDRLTEAHEAIQKALPYWQQR